MRIRTERKTLLLLLSINFFVIVLQLIIFASNSSWESRELQRALIASLVYVNVTAIPTMLILPGLLGKIALRKKSLLLPAMILGLLFFILAGCLVAQTLLWWPGVFTQYFWSYYLRMLPPALLAALIFGVGAFLYGSMQERLHRAEEKLHEKELLEERAQKLAVEARLDSLASRLHPHFLFNTLNSISALIVDNPTLAEKTVGRLATLLRSSLDNTNQPLIPLRQELQMIRDYFEIERVRFGDRLVGRIDAPEELQDAPVPPLSILSLVENAVKHGISPQPAGGELVIAASTKERDASLLIEVHDTGPGFKLAAIPAGHGLDNLVVRLHALFGEKAHLNVLQRDKWCIVQMVLPRS
jgi:two-component system, LytTR family, sensor histidine kinase AlgZ